MLMDYDSASPDELRQAAYEMQRKAAATGDAYRWAAQQQEAAVKRSIAVPVNMAALDHEALQRHYRVANARSVIEREAEASGLAAQWRADDQRARRTQEAEAELGRYFSSLEGSGPLGRLMAGKNVELHDPNIDRPKGRQA
jgi:hypothetical protein